MELTFDVVLWNVELNGIMCGKLCFMNLFWSFCRGDQRDWWGNGSSHCLHGFQWRLLIRSHMGGWSGRLDHMGCRVSLLIGYTISLVEEVVGCRWRVPFRLRPVTISVLQTSVYCSLLFAYILTIWMRKEVVWLVNWRMTPKLWCCGLWRLFSVSSYTRI